METGKSNWTTSEFMAYLLLYCASVDLNITHDEEEFIQSNLKSTVYQGIVKEFMQDNDFQRLQKIKHSFEAFDYTQQKTDQLFTEIKTLFMADGNYSRMEQFIYKELMRLLQQN